MAPDSLEIPVILIDLFAGQGQDVIKGPPYYRHQ
jgi:hypothetical protein